MTRPVFRVEARCNTSGVLREAVECSTQEEADEVAEELREKWREWASTVRVRERFE